MNRTYENAAQEALAVMEEAYVREQAAREEVFHSCGTSSSRGDNAGAVAVQEVIPHEGENPEASGDGGVFPSTGENEVYPEEVEAAEDLDAYVTDRALEELGHRFPQMDLAELAQNPLFIRFAAGEGRDFREICENFDAFIDQARSLVRSAALPDRRTSAAPPVRRIPLSHVQRRELAAWNAANPAYRMSEADYFKRLRG